MKQTTTSLRSLFGQRLADGMCGQGDLLLKGLRKYDPTWPIEDTIAQTAMASAALQHPWPDSRDEQEDMLFFNHAMLQWLKWQRPTFVLSKDLYAALMLTDCRGLKGVDLKFPFSSFCLVLPENNGLFVRETADNVVWPVGMLNFAIGRTMLRNQTTPESERMGDICTAVNHKGIPQEPLLSALRKDARETHRKMVPQLSPWSIIRLFSTENPMGLALHRVYVLPQDDESLEKWLVGSKTIKGPLEVAADEEQVLTMAHRLVANFVIYLNSSTLPTPERQSSILKKKSFSNQEARIYRVGGEVRLPHHLFDAARNSINQTKQKAMWRLHSRFVVRGHWRNVPHGPGKKERKRMWIQPFWKGPTTAEAMSRIYTTE